MSPQDQAPLFGSISNDPDMLELVEAFVEAIPERVRLLEHAIRTSDIAEIVRLARQLKGACGGSGFEAIGEAAGSLEASARASESIDDVFVQVTELISMCLRATVRPATS